MERAHGHFVTFLHLMTIFSVSFKGCHPAADEGTTTAIYDYQTSTVFRTPKDRALPLDFGNHNSRDPSKGHDTSGHASHSAQMHVTVLWRSHTEPTDFILAVQPVKWCRAWTSPNCSDDLFLVEHFNKEPTVFFKIVDNQTLSRNLKAGLAKKFILAFSGLPKENVSGELWTLPAQYGSSKSSDFAFSDVRPHERRVRSSNWTYSIKGQDDAWNSLRFYETTITTLPWTDEPLYIADSLTILTKSHTVDRPEFLATFHDQGQDRPQVLSRAKEYSDKFVSKYQEWACTERDLLPLPPSISLASDMTPEDARLAKQMRSLRKYTLKSKTASTDASRAFLSLHATLEASDKENILQALRDAMKLKKKQASSMLFLLDLIASHQSTAGLDAVLAVLDYNKSADLHELFRRYLMASSFAANANENVIHKLLDILEKAKSDESLQETLALTIGALTYTARNDKPTVCASPVASASLKTDLDDRVTNTFSNKLAKCGGQNTVSCQIKWLRALGNMASYQSLPLLLDFVQKGHKLTPVAIGSLRRFRLHANGSDSSLTHQATESVWLVYESSKIIYDSTCKIAAMEFLLQREKSIQMIARLLLQVPKMRTQELQTYVMTTMQNTIKDPALLRNGFNLAAKQSTRFNYWNLGSSGQSIAYQGNLFRNDALNATYSLTMEFSSGSMKTSGVGVGVAANQTTFPVIKFALFSRGLSSFMGSDAKEQEEEGDSESATAGLDLDLLDVSLPSVIFFDGMSELMSLAFSGGGGDDPVAQLQFNLLVQDTTVVHVSANGVPFRSRTRSALSVDFSGFVDVSLWGRTFKSLVRNRAAIATKTVTNVMDNTDSQDDRKISDVVTDLVQGRMDFITNVDFSSFPVKMCMEMNSSSILYRDKKFLNFFSFFLHMHAAGHPRSQAMLQGSAKDLFPEQHEILQDRLTLDQKIATTADKWPKFKIQKAQFFCPIYGAYRDKDADS